MNKEVSKIICEHCIVKAVCDDPCVLYSEVFNPLYKEMKIIEKKIGRRLHPSEVWQLAVNSAKRMKEDERNKV